MRISTSLDGVSGNLLTRMEITADEFGRAVLERAVEKASDEIAKLFVQQYGKNVVKRMVRDPRLFDTVRKAAAQQILDKFNVPETSLQS